MQNVLDYGAKGDGKTLDTAAIQAAIDAGGEVYFPAGTYLTGTLYLKSNGGLNLAQGAVIKASHNREDYNADDFCPQNRVFADEEVTGAHLITAVGQENIYIRGKGMIDGDANYWMNDSRLSYLNKASSYTPNENRIGQMIFICECSNVTVTDVTLYHASYWHLFFHGCTDVRVDGLLIRGQIRQYTNDGIDIDCCKRVTISNCNIHVGDDAIAVRANDAPLTVRRPCEDVTVTNCVLSSNGDYGIRVGVGKGLIRNCVFSNLVIDESAYGIGLGCRFSPEATGGVRIENLFFNNIIIRARMALQIRTSRSDVDGEITEETYVKNVKFSNIHAESVLCNDFVCHPNTEISDIVFKDVDFVTGGEELFPTVFDMNRWFSQKGYAVEIRDIKSITLDRVSIKYKPNTTDFENGLYIKNSGAILENCKIDNGILEE